MGSSLKAKTTAFLDVNFLLQENNLLHLGKQKKVVSCALTKNWQKKKV